MNEKIKKTAYLGVFSAVAIIFGYVESLFPLGIPGVKLGLANLVIVFLLYLYGAKEVVAVSFVRILVIGFLFGNLFSIVYSLAGAALSLTVMLLLKKTGKFKIVTVSAVGGVCHNIGQLAAAAALLGTRQVLWYAVALLPAGLLTGGLIGLLAGQLLPRLNRLR